MYFDTADFDLTRHGAALRVRRDGRRWEATAKWQGDVEGALHARPELTVPLPRQPADPFTLPDGPLRMHLTALVMGRPLAPILATDIRRRRFDVVAPAHLKAGPALAEIALDQVTFRRPDGTPAASDCEVEIELRQGTAKDIAALTELLQERAALTASPHTKLGRGLRAVHGARCPTPIAPQRVRGSDSVAAAARKIVGAHLARLRDCDPGTRLGDNLEALHAMRVATRRLRAAVHTLETGLPERVEARLERELRWLGHTLGAVRDPDVQLAHLAEHSSALPAAYRDALEPFQRHLQTTRSAQRAILLAALDSPRYFRLLAELKRFALRRARPHSPSAQQPIGTLGAIAVERAFRRLLKRGRRVSATPAPEDLHALRIRAKRLRYLLEFLHDVTGKPGRHLTRQLVRLQDLLGICNDTVVAADFVCRYLDGAGAQLAPSTALALQEVAQAALRRGAAARAEFKQAWRRFSAKRNQREFRAVLERLDASAQRD